MRDTDEMLSALQRMNRLLALVAVKGVERKDAVLILTRAGYTQGDIGSLLDMKLSAVGMILLRHRRGDSSKKAKKAANHDDGE